jgi:hypothetical protein
MQRGESTVRRHLTGSTVDGTAWTDAAFCTQPGVQGRLPKVDARLRVTFTREIANARDCPGLLKVLPF